MSKKLVHIVNELGPVVSHVHFQYIWFDMKEIIQISLYTFIFISKQVGNPVHQCGLSNKPADLKVLQFDDSTISLSVFDHQQQQLLLSQSHQHSCAMEAANLRCQSQPAGVAGVPTCACGSVASAECLSRQAGLKRRRCSHDVGSVWESDSGAFLLGSHQQVGSFDTTSFNLDAAISNTTAVEMNQEASVSPLRLQQQGQSDLSAHSQVGVVVICA